MDIPSSRSSSSATRRQAQLALQLCADTGDEAGAEVTKGPLWSCADLPAPTVTTHAMATEDGGTLEYTATAGLLPVVLEESDGPAGSIFFAAYTLEQPAGAPRDKSDYHQV